MQSTALFRIHPSLSAGMIAGALFLMACASSTGFERTVQLVIQTGWLYVSNTRG